MENVDEADGMLLAQNIYNEEWPLLLLPRKHESETRGVNNNVWEEIRNFKKCLIMMYAKQDKKLVFLETAMDLEKQRCHCLNECIPLPKKFAKQAPLYFKKASVEAEAEDEDEWSQHNGKKLIDISEKSLHGSIPKHLPYFLVEFRLDKGFAHVIDDKKQFQSCFCLNVIRVMLGPPDEDMYRRMSAWRHRSWRLQALHYYDRHVISRLTSNKFHF